MHIELDFTGPLIPKWETYSKFSAGTEIYGLWLFDTKEYPNPSFQRNIRVSMNLRRSGYDATFLRVWNQSDKLIEHINGHTDLIERLQPLISLETPFNVFLDFLLEDPDCPELLAQLIQMVSFDEVSHA